MRREERLFLRANLSPFRHRKPIWLPERSTAQQLRSNVSVHLHTKQTNIFWIKYLKSRYKSVRIVKCGRSAYQRMQVAQRALLRRFPSKNADLQAAMDWVADRQLGRLELATAPVRSPLAALENVFGAHIDLIIAHPGVTRMLFSELHHA